VFPVETKQQVCELALRMSIGENPTPGTKPNTLRESQIKCHQAASQWSPHPRGQNKWGTCNEQFERNLKGQVISGRAGKRCNARNST